MNADDMIEASLATVIVGGEVLSSDSDDEVASL